MSDKEQRDLAEKIRQENLLQEKAALEALKKQETTEQEEESAKVRVERRLVAKVRTQVGCYSLEHRAVAAVLRFV